MFPGSWKIFHPSRLQTLAEALRQSLACSEADSACRALGATCKKERHRSCLGHALSPLPRNSCECEGVRGHIPTCVKENLTNTSSGNAEVKAVGKSAT